MTNEPNDFDDFATHIHSDELIPEGYEDRELEELENLADDEGEPDSDDPDFVRWQSWEPNYYGHDADGYDGGDDFPW